MKKSLAVLVILVGVTLQARTLATSNYGGSVQKAIAALPVAGGTVVIDTAQILKASITLRSNVTLSGTPDAVLTTSGNFDIFGFTGVSNVTIENVVMSGGHSAISAYNADHVTLRNNHITGWSYRGIDLGANMPTTKIEGNTLEAPHASCVDGILLQDTGTGLRVAGNRVDITGCNPQAHGIAVHTNQQGLTVIAPLVEDNDISGSGNFGIEVGQFNAGGRVQQPVIRHNHTLATGVTNGGISMVGSDNGTTEGNTIDLNGQAPQIGGIEIGDAPAALVATNRVINGGPGTRALILDSTSDALVTGNQFGGYIFIVNSGTFPGSNTLARNTVMGNSLLIAPGSTWAYAVFLQCNVDLCDGTGNRISYNRMGGSTVGILAPEAIHQEADKGTITGTMIESNITGVFQ